MPKQKEKSLGTLIDELYLNRAQRIDAQRKVDEMKREERKVAALIMEKLEAQKTEASRGKIATASITTSIKPHTEVIDWKKVWAYVHKHKAFHLLHKRIAVEAWMELHLAGKQVPGIDAVEVKDLSLTKATKG